MIARNPPTTVGRSIKPVKPGFLFPLSRPRLWEIFMSWKRTIRDLVRRRRDRRQKASIDTWIRVGNTFVTAADRPEYELDEQKTWMIVRVAPKHAHTHINCNCDQYWFSKKNFETFSENILYTFRERQMNRFQRCIVTAVSSLFPFLLRHQYEQTWPLWG